MDPNYKPARPADPVRTDYTHPIALPGEQQFACILRNRSGESSGCIDMGARFITELCDGDQQAAVNSAFAIYAKWVSETGKRAARDHQSTTLAAREDGWRLRRLHEIRAIIEAVDNRAMAEDGDMRSTMQVMTQAEMSRIYELTAVRDATAREDGDRAMLIYLMGQFDGEFSVCECCGHEEPTSGCDSAIALRAYLYPPTAQARGESDG